MPGIYTSLFTIIVASEKKTDRTEARKLSRIIIIIIVNYFVARLPSS